MSIYQKVRLAVLGHVNELVNKVIDENSPVALRQLILDLENTQAEVRNNTAVQQGLIPGLQRAVAYCQTRITEGTAKAKALLAVITPDMPAAKADSIKALARARAKDTLDAQAELPAAQAALEAQQAVVVELHKSSDVIATVHDEKARRLRTLTNMDLATKSKEQAARALEAANSIMASGSSISVDDIEARMQQHSDIVDAKFQSALGAIPQPEADPVADAQLDALMASLAPPALTAAGK